jgi:hypothetical protein
MPTSYPAIYDLDGSLYTKSELKERIDYLISTRVMQGRDTASRFALGLMAVGRKAQSDGGKAPRLPFCTLRGNELEQAREQKGFYSKTVFNDMPFYYNSEYRSTHFLRLAADDEKMVSYSELAIDREGKERIKHIKMKPGRYLTKFFPDLGQARITALARYFEIGDLSEIVEKLEFVISDDFVKIYGDGKESGVSSCMAKPNSHFRHGKNPVFVYGAGDLKIAALRRGAYTQARALVWPENKVYGRVYPNPDMASFDGLTQDQAEGYRQQLKKNLEDLGYAEDNDCGFDGARLLKARISGKKYHMPYLDKDYGVCDDVEFFVMRQKKPDFSAQETSGFINAITHFDDDDDDDDDDYMSEYAYTCENCGEGCDDTITVYSRNWCESCVDRDAFYCEGTDSYYPSDTVSSYEVTTSKQGRTQTWSEFAVENYANRCAISKRLCAENLMTEVTTKYREVVRVYDNELAENTFECLIGNELYMNDAMSEDWSNVSDYEAKKVDIETLIKSDAVYTGDDLEIIARLDISRVKPRHCTQTLDMFEMA